jgi:ubiquinone/menaquinone biosynthesis C-methylase UbiE
MSADERGSFFWSQPPSAALRDLIQKTTAKTLENSMDDIAKYNVTRWRALVSANAIFTRPDFNLDRDSARHLLDPEGKLGELAGKEVLCLASGGGRQSVAFALLDANVTVADLSEEQLQRDAVAAAHYKLKVNLVRSDMRDLSAFDDKSFDIVYHGYSLNFVRDAGAVFRQVARVLRTGGVYSFGCANPAFMGIRLGDWNGTGYLLTLPYLDGVEVVYPDEPWVFKGELPVHAIPPGKEYRHTLSTIVKGLTKHGLRITDLNEENFGTPDSNGEPCTPEHRSAFAPPWLTVWAVKG